MKWEDEICHRLVSDNIIKSEDKSIIQYGLHQLFFLLANLITLFLICTIFKGGWRGVIFLLFFWPLRIYAGGYHADTEIKCYILSTMAETVIFYVCNSMEINLGIKEGIIIIITSILIIILAPQDTISKKLCECEYAAYKVKVKIILSIQMFAFLTCYLKKWNTIGEVLILSHGLMVVLLIAGCIKKGLCRRCKDV